MTGMEGTSSTTGISPVARRAVEGMPVWLGISSSRIEDMWWRPSLQDFDPEHRDELGRPGTGLDLETGLWLEQQGEPSELAGEDVEARGDGEPGPERIVRQGMRYTIGISPEAPMKKRDVAKV